MKLVTFTHKGQTRTGGLRGEQIIDLNTVDSSIPTCMLTLLEGGDSMLGLVKAAIAAGPAAVSLAEVKLECPVQRPGKILAIGLNYKDHRDEALADVMRKRGLKDITAPIIFNKQSTSAAGPHDPIAMPMESSELDYEAELGVIIGKSCRRVKAEDALDVVAGYTVLNDVSVRDWQRATPTMTMGKSWDTHCPMGPCLVTADEIGDPHTLDVTCTVNNEKRQSFNTSYMLFSIAGLISHLSTAFTLEPGDVIATGTSTGAGHYFNGGTYLREGDIVRIEIEKIGFIENRVEADSASFIR